MSLELCLRSRQRTRAVDLPLLRRMARHLLGRHFGRDRCALAIHLIATPEMAQLNEQFLGHAGPTDVITFDLSNEGGETNGPSRTLGEAKGPRPSRAGRSAPGRPDGAAFLQGEIFVSLDEALRQARRYQTTWQEELARYVIHGLLHLHGYDDLDPSARRVMKRAENRLLRQISRSFDLKQLTRKKRAAHSGS